MGSSIGQYERIQHMPDSAVKINVTCINSSAYHWHYDYELIFVLKGHIEVKYGLYGAEGSVLRAGDMIMINPKGVHEVHGFGGDNMCACIQFSESLLDSAPEGMKYYFYLNSSKPEYQPAKVYACYGRIIARTCLAAKENSKAASMKKKAWLYLLLVEMITGVQYELRASTAVSEENTELVMKISSFIDCNLQEEHLQEKIYRQFGLSEKSLYLLLKEVVGQTLKEMVDTARIEKACSMLQNSSIPLQVISDTCGYSGEATFYRRFRAAMGITPGAYRKGMDIKEASNTNEIQDYLSLNDAEAEAQLRYWAELGEWAIGQ